MSNTIVSTITGNSLIDYIRIYDTTIPTFGLAGYSLQPTLTFENDVMQKIIAENNPWKFNSYVIPPFYTQPYQQDYPTSISASVMGWLESATFVDINNPAGTPQYFIRPPMQAVARLLPTDRLGIPSEVCWLMNRNAQLGQWPGSGTTYLTPLIVNGGGPGSNPLTAIQDTNGNIQVVTTYGITGSIQPTWPAANAVVGTTTTDGTVVWTVQDPNGVTFRLNALATYGSNVWQINLTYQKKAPLITSLTQTFDPIPDDLGYLIRNGFRACCYQQMGRQDMYAQWLEAIQIAMGETDREAQSFGMYPADAIQGPGRGGQAGGWGYVGWPGWNST